MDKKVLLKFLAEVEKLKCHTRHSWTSSGRRESVAEHTSSLCMFAWLLRGEFPELDMVRVLELCLFHDLGEAVVGDVPCFEKTKEDEDTEAHAWHIITQTLPQKEQEELRNIFTELQQNQTEEARLVHALDKMEAVIQHNEAPIDSWLPLEYELQLTYGTEQANAFAYTKGLRDVIRDDSRMKIEAEALFNQREHFFVSKASHRLSLKRIVALMRQTYWGKERSEAVIQKAMENSVCYGVYDKKEYQVGYARIITDDVTSFYLMDVIIDEAYRGQGLGTMLIESIMDDTKHMHGILHTKDAQEFYKVYGFQHAGQTSEVVMEKEKEN